MQIKSKAGVKSFDSFLTIVQTAKKLGVCAYKYIVDRISYKFELPSLAEIIEERSKSVKET